MTVDDRVPCSKCGKPLYARSLDPNETWVMILEKAYAKLHGCYEALTAGFIDYGLRDLTGAATMKWKWADKKIKAKLDNNTLWSELLALKEEGSLLGCSNAISGSEHSSASGLLSGCAGARGRSPAAARRGGWRSEAPHPHAPPLSRSPFRALSQATRTRSSTCRRATPTRARSRTRST